MSPIAFSSFPLDLAEHNEDASPLCQLVNQTNIIPLCIENAEIMEI